MDSYNNSYEHIMAELKRLNLLIQIQLQWMQRNPSPHLYDEFKGFYISKDQIEDIIQNHFQEDNYTFSRDKNDDEYQKLCKESIRLYKEIDSRKKASLNRNIFLPFHRLSILFNLTSFELDVILICVAHEINLQYETLYAYIQNDITKKKPSVELMFTLLALSNRERVYRRSVFFPESCLRRFQILNYAGENPEDQTPLLSRAFKLDNRIVAFLLELNCVDSLLSEFVRVLQPRLALDDLNLQEQTKTKIVNITKIYTQLDEDEEHRPLTILFYGHNGHDKLSSAEALCKHWGLSLLIVDLRKMLNKETAFKRTIHRVFREALLHFSTIYFDQFDQLLAKDDKTKILRDEFFQVLETFQGITFLDSQMPWVPNFTLHNKTFLSIEISVPYPDKRLALWKSVFDGKFQHITTSDLLEVATKFRFTEGQIKSAFWNAQQSALLEQPEDDLISLGNIYQACRNQSNQKLVNFAQKIEPRHGWGDIVLPKDNVEQLREICSHVKYRSIVFDNWGFERKLSLGKGLNILFSGPSGTGKTLASEILAKELHLDLFKIDMSNVVSKYIGETEKNLSEIFKEAETSNAILFFDEADALFGKRSEVKDSHDRYANIEISYLLQKMDEHEGIVIMATNLVKNIDEAFTRRMHFSIGFPSPNEELRYQLWQEIFPEEASCSEDIDFDFLAKSFEISGGHIKNIILAAAFSAAGNSGVISMEHIIRATKREFQKMGRLCVKTEFGSYYEFVEGS
ncbi:MAG: ATP-binding protein [Deltaproteobacteria bacterium]|nr:ATP-binding protein [Deltaproteobacteria bacterium]